MPSINNYTQNHYTFIWHGTQEEAGFIKGNLMVPPKCFFPYAKDNLRNVESRHSMSQVCVKGIRKKSNKTSVHLKLILTRLTPEVNLPTLTFSIFLVILELLV